MKWNKGKRYKIRCFTGVKLAVGDVSRNGLWGIGKDPNDGMSPVRLTHIPTGYAIPYIAGELICRKVAYKLAAMRGVKWAKITKRGVPKPYGSRVRAIIKAINGL